LASLGLIFPFGVQDFNPAEFHDERSDNFTSLTTLSWRFAVAEEHETPLR
jgi:hypothetical protein